MQPRTNRTTTDFNARVVKVGCAQPCDTCCWVPRRSCIPEILRGERVGGATSETAAPHTSLGTAGHTHLKTAAPCAIRGCERVGKPLWVGKRLSGSACACACGCAPAVGTIHLGGAVLYSCMRACYICLRSRCGSVGNIYNVFLFSTKALRERYSSGVRGGNK